MNERVNASNAEATFVQSSRTQRVLAGEYPCARVSVISGLLHYFVLAKLAATIIRPKKSCLFPVTLP